MPSISPARWEDDLNERAKGYAQFCIVEPIDPPKAVFQKIRCATDFPRMRATLMFRRFIFLIFLATLAGCQSTARRVTIDTSDGQPLPSALITAGGSQQNLNRSVTVESGRATRLAFWVFANPDCTNFGYTDVRESAPPEHGALIVRRVEDFGYWPPQNPRSACNKRRVPGVLIEYKSASGFAGIDHVAYDLFFPNSGSRHVEITVNVK